MSTSAPGADLAQQVTSLQQAVAELQQRSPGDNLVPNPPFLQLLQQNAAAVAAALSPYFLLLEEVAEARAYIPAGSLASAKGGAWQAVQVATVDFDPAGRLNPLPYYIAPTAGIYAVSMGVLAEAVGGASVGISVGFVDGSSNLIARGPNVTASGLVSVTFATLLSRGAGQAIAAGIFPSADVNYDATGPSDNYFTAYRVA